MVGMYETSTKCVAWPLDPGTPGEKPTPAQQAEGDKPGGIGASFPASCSKDLPLPSPRVVLFACPVEKTWKTWCDCCARASAAAARTVSLGSKSRRLSASADASPQCCQDHNIMPKLVETGANFVDLWMSVDARTRRKIDKFLRDQSVASR